MKADDFAEVIATYLDEVDRKNLRDYMSNMEMAFTIVEELVDRGLLTLDGKR